VSELSFRDARMRDVPSIVAMLADDDFGPSREDVGAIEGYSLFVNSHEGFKLEFVP